MTDTNIKAFTQVVRSFFDFIEKQVPEHSDRVRTYKLKFDAAIEVFPTHAVNMFVKELKPYAADIATRNEKVLLTECVEKVAILKDIDLINIWKNLSTNAKDEVWNRLNSALMLATVASNADAASLQGPMEGIDPNELGNAVQNVLPTVMKMMGPMMAQLGGGNVPGNRDAQRKAAKEAANPNSPMMQMISGLVGSMSEQGDAPKKTRLAPAGTPVRKLQTRERLRAKLEAKRKAQEERIEEVGDDSDEEEEPAQDLRKSSWMV
jgi:hypothetical protein